MRNISEDEKQRTIKWLQKQRDGLIIGDYRNILYSIYQTIQDVSQTTSNGCDLEKLTKSITDKIQISNQVMEFCETLCELGYIMISHDNNATLFFILKPIDF